MPQNDDPPRHNLRLTPELKAKLGHAAIDNRRSMNAEIVERLNRSFEPDPAALIAQALRPVAGLTDADRQKVGELLAAIGSILSKGQQQ
jgi:hypothetical protein